MLRREQEREFSVRLWIEADVLFRSPYIDYYFESQSVEKWERFNVKLKFIVRVSARWRKKLILDFIHKSSKSVALIERARNSIEERTRLHVDFW